MQVSSGRVTGPSQGFGSDPIAEAYVVAGPNRTYREPGIEYPGLPSLPVWDGNPEVFELDPNRLGLSNPTVAAGGSFSATGVLGYEYGGYELWPTSLALSQPTLPIAVRARAAGEMTVGSLNMLRLYDDVNDPGTADDSSTPSAAVYALRLRKLSLYVRTVLGSPDVLGAQEVENLNALQDLAAQIADRRRDRRLHRLPGGGQRHRWHRRRLPGARQRGGGRGDAARRDRAPLGGQLAAARPAAAAARRPLPGQRPGLPGRGAGRAPALAVGDRKPQRRRTGAPEAVGAGAVGRADGAGPARRRSHRQARSGRRLQCLRVHRRLRGRGRPDQGQLRARRTTCCRGPTW